MENQKTGILVKLVDTPAKSADDIAAMYWNAAENDPLGRVAFCTDAEADIKLADQYTKMILAWEDSKGEMNYIQGNIIDMDFSHDPEAPKGFKRKIMGRFADLLPKEFDREMKSTWILLDNLKKLDPQETAAFSALHKNDLYPVHELLNDREKQVTFTYLF
jgi:hypothetical protein